MIERRIRRTFDGVSREKLKRLPCVVVHYDGKPVAYEMSDFAGLFNHLYVDKNHRRKGLAKCVELYLCQKFIRYVMNSGISRPEVICVHQIYKYTRRSDVNNVILSYVPQHWISKSAHCFCMQHPVDQPSSTETKHTFHSLMNY